MNARDLADALNRRDSDMGRHPVRWGLVKDVYVDDDQALVKVEIQPDGVMTDFIRYEALGGLSLGNWVALALPALEAEVLLLAEDPDCHSYVAKGGFFNPDDKPPSGYQLGQVLFQHPQTGNQFLMDQDGMIYVGAQSGAQPLVQQPWIEDTHNTHFHPHPLGPTSPPANPWTSGDVTQKCKGA